MKSFTTTAALVASLLPAAVLGQLYNQTAPFYLTLSSPVNASLNGLHLSSCHIGAAIEALCLVEDLNPPYTTYYLNYTQWEYVNGEPAGPLVWNLPAVINNTPTNVSEPMQLVSDPSTNVLVPQLYPGDTYTSVGFDADSKLFLPDSSYNDSNFQPGVYPAPSNVTALYQWYACWTDNTGYYYHTLAWVSYGTPKNPTCEAVNVTRTFI